MSGNKAVIKKLFSDKFRKKYDEALKELHMNIGDTLGLNKSKIIFYPFTGKAFHDIRNVFIQTTKEDAELIKYYKPFWDKGQSRWQSIANVAQAVNNRIRYVHDIDNFGSFEYWASPIITHNIKFDDCDGYACLLTYVLRLLGLSEREVFTRVGRVRRLDGSEGEYHANTIVLDRNTMLYYPLEGSWYARLAMEDFLKKENPLLSNHPRYFNTDWITNDKLSFANNRWFKFIK